MQIVNILGVIIAFATIVCAEVTMKSEKFPRTREIRPRADLYSMPFTVPLDHFSPQDERIVTFTYVQNLENYYIGGPIFIYINDAGVFTTEFLESGLMHDIAVDARAMLVTADNRFFRSNLPTEDASLENLQFLTIEQTINDIGRLIQVVKSDLGTPDARVILWGSGLGATLATWTRQKFPHLVNGVWSSSGTYEHIVHTNEPYEQLTRTLAAIGGQECADNMFSAYEGMEVMIFRGQNANLFDLFYTCFTPLPYDYEAAAFFSGITQLIIDYINIHHFHGVANLCTDLNATDVTETEAMARWVRHVFTGEFCLDVSFDFRAFEASLTDWDDIFALSWTQGLSIAYPFISRPLFYLRCTQLGLFPTSVNARSSFGNAIGQDLWFVGCNAAFGSGYDYTLLQNAVEQLDFQYGGKNPAVTNAIFTNGELDTQFAFGITESSGDQTTHVRNIPNYAKSADLWSAGQHDSAELASIKDEIRQLVLEWSGAA